MPKNLPADAKEVNVNDNDILRIETGTFSHLLNCNVLSLAGNKLTHIKAGMFEGLQSLQKLSLSDNNITDIEPGSFSPLKECIHLWLKNNKLTKIKMGMFEGLDSLEALILTNNWINGIEHGSFTHTKQLRRLFLNKNELTFLDKEAFQIPFPTNLSLLIENNRFQCNQKMCWIKQGEQDGWITSTLGEYVKPSCLNYPGLGWDEIILNCTMQGEFQ